MGIEPTAPGVSPEPDGFEGRADHQTRIASGAGPKHNTKRGREQPASADRNQFDIYSQSFQNGFNRIP